MVEHHFEGLRAYARLLSRRLSLTSKWSYRPNPRRDGQTEAVAKDEEQEGCKGNEDWHRKIVS
jgi:hypothetical protein